MLTIFAGIGVIALVFGVFALGVNAGIDEGAQREWRRWVEHSAASGLRPLDKP